jgi:polyhydroxybutyrate depolymerase
VDAPVASAAAFWAAQNGCAAAPQRQDLGTIRFEAYTGCRGGTGVALYAIRGGGHAWPGGGKVWRFAPSPTRELSATERMWEFFAAHPKS